MLPPAVPSSSQVTERERVHHRVNVEVLRQIFVVANEKSVGEQRRL